MAIKGIGALGAASGVTALKAQGSINTSGVQTQIGHGRFHSIGSRHCAVKAKILCCSVRCDLLDSEYHSHERPHATVHV